MLPGAFSQDPWCPRTILILGASVIKHVIEPRFGKVFIGLQLMSTSAMSLVSPAVPISGHATTPSPLQQCLCSLVFA
jgi:hypothetical protein